MCVFWEGKLSLCVSIYLFQNILKSKNKVWQKWQLLLENSSGKANPLRAVGILRQLCFPSRGGIQPGISFLVPTAEAPAGPSPENCSGRRVLSQGPPLRGPSLSSRARPPRSKLSILGSPPGPSQRHIDLEVALDASTRGCLVAPGSAWNPRDWGG